MKTKKYRGYVGAAKVDFEAGIIHGEVVGTRDMITFQGKTVEEAAQAFRDSVDDYLAFCAERGVQPDKPLSGHFATHVSRLLHHQAVRAAAAAGVSLNAWVAAQLRRGVADAAAAESARAAKKPAPKRRPADKSAKAG